MGHISKNRVRGIVPMIFLERFNKKQFLIYLHDHPATFFSATISTTTALCHYISTAKEPSSQLSFLNTFIYINTELFFAKELLLAFLATADGRLNVRLGCESFANSNEYLRFPVL